MDEVTPGWVFGHIGFEDDDVRLSGVRLWESAWGPSQDQITVAHPRFPNQRHTMWVYRVVDEQADLEFAAGEFSNGVWGFFFRQLPLLPTDR